RQRPAEFESGAERRQADDVLGMAGKQKLLDHVKRQQRSHAIIGKPLCEFGRRKDRKPGRMATERLARDAAFLVHAAPSADPAPSKRKLASPRARAPARRS